MHNKLHSLLSRLTRPFSLTVISFCLVLVCFVVVDYWGFSTFTDQTRVAKSNRSHLELSTLLGRGSASGDEGYEKAVNPKSFQFPQDHLAHPGFRSEWWYFTGHLTDSNNREKQFGYQFTLFRQAVAPNTNNQDADASTNTATNPWQNPQFYMAHFAITNIDKQDHRAVEKFSRAGPGLAGTSPAPLSFWIEHWRLESVQTERLFPLKLVAKDNNNNISLDLLLSSDKPPTLQGNLGLSQKSPEPGNASYYYSYTRLNASGTVRWDETTTQVKGSSWFDHEWSTSLLNSHQKGWDWFSLQLADGYDLMYFRIRSDDKASATEAITLVDPDGNRVPVNASNLVLKELTHWTSPNGKRYPAKWLLELPDHKIAITITPKVPDQEMRLTVNYWEGAVEVEGSHSGLGYVELTGY